MKREHIEAFNWWLATSLVSGAFLAGAIKAVEHLL
jgi:hypothetical protein